MYKMEAKDCKVMRTKTDVQTLDQNTKSSFLHHTKKGTKELPLKCALCHLLRLCEFPYHKQSENTAKTHIFWQNFCQINFTIKRLHCLKLFTL